MSSESQTLWRGLSSVRCLQKPALPLLALQLSTDRTKPDAVQTFYGNALFKKGIGVARNLTYVGAKKSVDRGASTLNKIKASVAKDFSETPWSRLAPLPKATGS